MNLKGGPPKTKVNKIIPSAKISLLYSLLIFSFDHYGLSKLYFLLLIKDLPSSPIFIVLASSKNIFSVINSP